MVEIAVREAPLRGALFALGRFRPRLEDPRSIWLAPGSTVIGNVRIGADTSVWFGAVIRADNEPMQIGCGVNIQDGSVLHSDPGFPLTIGDCATIGHRAIVHGCEIGAGVLVGMGATVMNGARIGENSILGAGALVPEGVSVPPGSLAVGVPARVVRKLEGEQVTAGRVSASQYRDRARLYRSRLATVEEGG